MWSGDLPGGPGEVERPSPTFGRVSRPLPHLLEGIPTTSGNTNRPSDYFRNSWRASRPFPVLWEGLPTTPGTLGGPLDHCRTSGRAS